MCGVYERIEKLIKETIDLRKEIKDLKETLTQKNELIISLLTEKTGISEETTEVEQPLVHLFNDNQISDFSRRFPLESVEDLKKFEAEITDENENYIINIVHALLAPQGLSKNLSNVLSEHVIMDVNMEGFQHKKRLLSFTKTINILFQACRKDNDYTTKTFLNDLRKSLRLVKNRIHSSHCKARRILRVQKKQEQLVQTVEEFIKTEEVDFD